MEACSPIINIIIWLCQEVVILCRSLLHKSSHVIFPIWKFRRRCLFGDKGYLICLTVRTLNMDEYKPNDQINGLALVFNHPLAKLSSHLNCSATGHSNILQVMNFCWQTASISLASVSQHATADSNISRMTKITPQVMTFSGQETGIAYLTRNGKQWQRSDHASRSFDRLRFSSYLGPFKWFSGFIKSSVLHILNGSKKLMSTLYSIYI